MITPIILLSLLGTLFGLILAYSAIRFKVAGNPIVDEINALLPQTQCGQCSYPGCNPYAEAIANQEADINQCPPGGDVTIKALAVLLGCDTKPLNQQHQLNRQVEKQTKYIALIDEQMCIGCTLCIQVCPVDAILGATKQMHTVVTDECTGCDLCLPPCPVDCIDMIAQHETSQTWKTPYPLSHFQIRHSQISNDQKGKPVNVI